MATIPTPPPPLPPLQRPKNLSTPPPPPPPPTHHAAHPLQKRPARIPKQNYSVSFDELSSLTDLIRKDGAPSELVTSSVSTSPTAESDTQDSSPPKQTAPSENIHASASRNDDRPPRSPPPPRSDGVLSTSSMASSPRRPRRMGTGVPENTRVSDLDFEVSDDIGVSARDEFEEEFLNRHPADRESQIISDVLERVDFRQLSDDEEEMLSDDGADPSRGESTARRVNDRVKHSKTRSYDLEYAHANIPKIRQSTVHSHWRRIPSEVGCRGCEGCNRLCEENHKLRRQLDELEFELASGALHTPPDGLDSPPLPGRPTSRVPQMPMLTKKKSGWANKLRNASMLPATSSSKPSERTRLKSEVQALTVTTEYLWRKLNKAENELRNYRVKDLRSRMELSAARKATSNHDGVKSRERQLDLVDDADWDWE